MYIEQLYTGCLSEAAYYIESNGEAAIIDPIRETQPYLELAEKRGAKIRYIFETHFHADFVSGHIDLAAKTGAEIVYGPNAKPLYEVTVAEDGQVFKLGALSLEVLHTPGHTLESSCFLLKDENGKDHAVFTGDTLFVGAVGRPDLAVKSERALTPEELADMMYDSLKNKLMPLADDVIVYPAHGAGSSCGKGIGKERWSTMGEQRASNYALQPMSREDFVAEVAGGLLPPPPYFFDDARINMQGYDSLEEVMDRNMRALTADQVESRITNGALVLDARIPAEYEAGHIPGAYNIGINGSFAIWVGTLIPIEREIVVVAAEDKVEEAVTRLARVGFEKVAGYLNGGFSAWKEAGKSTSEVETIDVETMSSRMAANHIVLDVRKPGEFKDGHVAGAINLPLSQIVDRADELDKDKNYLVHCKSGYRSMVGASLLKSLGIQNLSNIAGGYMAIEKSDIAVETPVSEQLPA